MSVVILFLLSVATFALLRIAPGDAALLQQGGGFVAREQVEAKREELGLNKPYFPISFRAGFPPITFQSDSQYGSWASDVLRGDLGVNARTQVPVFDAIKDRLPTTVQLLVLTMFTTIVIGVPTGVVSALYRNSPIDLGIRFLAILMLSIPTFWIGTLVIMIPSQIWGYAPPIETIRFWEDPWTNLRQFVPPAIVLGTAASASIMRLTRSSLLEVMRADYVRTARAKGLREQAVVYQHAMKNVLIPVITVLGLQFTGLLGGTIFIEVIFNIKGLGLYTFEAILRKDYIVVQSITLYIGVVVVLTQLAIDVTYAWIDPRIRYS